MKDSELPIRKDIRLKNYDYSHLGHYFVTMCTYDRKNFLCQIVGGDAQVASFQTEMKLMDVGWIVDKYINNINKVYDNVKLDYYVIMPNHIHLIRVINNAIITDTNKTSLSQVINSFKVLTSKGCKCPIWQRNYYEHIIRTEQELEEIREYIQNNPLNWNKDMFYVE